MNMVGDPPNSLMKQLGVQHSLWQSGQAWLASVGWYPAAPITAVTDEDSIRKIIETAQQPDLPKL
jgi:hypothetical protein